MLDFLMVPLVVGIICAGIYGLFELFVRRKERLAIIEKIGEKLDASSFEGKLRLPSYGVSLRSFGSLKGGCLLAGIGLGLLVGFLLHLVIASAQMNNAVGRFSFAFGYRFCANEQRQRTVPPVGYGRCWLRCFRLAFRRYWLAYLLFD